jgi:hypothetical protein
MRSKIARVGVVAFGLLALIAGLTPPAQAAGTVTIAFVGSATIGSGLSYPCIGSGTTVDTNLCPTTKVNPPTGVLPGNPLTTLSHLGFLMASQLTLPAPWNAVPQHHIDLHHNRRTITGLSFGACVAAEVDSAKGVATDTLCSVSLPVPFPPATLPNTVAGNCGLSTGQVTADVLVLSLTYRVDVHFTALGGLLILEGHARKIGSSKTGLVVGAVAAIPPTPVTGGGTCLNKTARTFTIAGSVVGVSD